MEISKINHLIKLLASYFKEEGFKRLGTTWNKTVSNKIVAVINLQKDRTENNNITFNIGIYIVGTEELMFDKPLSFVQEYNCLFNERPRFFDKKNEWWNLGQDNNEQIVSEIIIFFKKTIIPFFSQVVTYEDIKKLLPIEKWKKNSNFSDKLIRLACLEIAFEKLDESIRLLSVVIDNKSIWEDCAKKILSKIQASQHQ